MAGWRPPSALSRPQIRASLDFCIPLLELTHFHHAEAYLGVFRRGKRASASDFIERKAFGRFGVIHRAVRRRAARWRPPSGTSKRACGSAVQTCRHKTQHWRSVNAEPRSTANRTLKSLLVSEMKTQRAKVEMECLHVHVHPWELPPAPSSGGPRALC